MNKLQRAFDRFAAKHSRLGIPNLMMYISVGIGIVYVFTMIDPNYVIYNFLRFDRDAILHGQVWRILTYVFIPSTTSIFWLFIQLYFYIIIGRILEAQWGAFRFNVFYFTGVLVGAIAGLLLKVEATTYYLNMSMFLAYATLYPENRVLIFFVIPVKIKWMAWLYLGFTALSVITTSFPANLFPIIALLNYFLFFYSSVFSFFRKIKLKYSSNSTNFRKERNKANKNWSNSYRNSQGQAPYRHKCAVCGKTDTEYPEMDFRYCSRCNGYYCYCPEHIDTHVHIV